MDDGQLDFEQEIERARYRASGELMIISEAIGLLIANHPEGGELLKKLGGYVSNWSTTVAGPDLNVAAETARAFNNQEAHRQGMSNAESAIRQSAEEFMEKSR